MSMTENEFSAKPAGAVPLCPKCDAEVLFECVACSAGNYPKPQVCQGVELPEPGFKFHGGGGTYCREQMEAYGDAREAALREALGAGDTCARSCEAQAVRVEALQLKRRVAELEAAGRADAVPEGYALVPRRELTDAEIDAFADHFGWCGEDKAHPEEREEVRRQWQAFVGIMAAPQQMTAQGEAVYQIRICSRDRLAWFDTSATAYEYVNEEERRTLYTHPSPVADAEALSICRALVKWCDENEQGGALWFVERARRLTEK